MRHFVSLGIDSIELGPRIFGAHQPNERVDIVEVALSAAAMAEIVKKEAKALGDT